MEKNLASTRCRNSKKRTVVFVFVFGFWLSRRYQVFAVALVRAESRESFSKPIVESDRLNQFYVEGQTVSITSPTNS